MVALPAALPGAPRRALHSIEMRALIVPIVVTGLALTAQPLFAGPAEDLAAYCRATNPVVQFQVRCIYTEKAAQGRLAATRASVTPDAWSRCESSSASWTAMEACLGAAGARGGAMTPAGGGATGEARAGDGARPDAATPAAAHASGPTAPSTAATPPSPAGEGSPSTVILGPQGGSTASAAEPNRVTRPVPQDEAERHLKSVLERSGDTQARCSKKQYSGGWVTVCE